MKHLSIDLIVALLMFSVGLSASVVWNAYRTSPELPSPSLNLTTLVAPSEATIDPSLPPPPPATTSAPTYQSPPEPPLKLLGASSEKLRGIEQYLPEGARIATYHVSESEQRAALASADLVGDGHIETVVIYKAPVPEAEGGDSPLFLGVLAHEGNKLTLRSSVRLSGIQVYSSIYDKHAVPLAIRDVTGDGRPEIIVTSGVGASLGGMLQVYSFDGSSLHQVADIPGHTLRVYYGGAGRPGKITAQGRYEEGARVYRWSGQKFEQAR